MLTRKQYLLAGLEPNYMEDPILTGANAMVIGNLDVNSYDGDKVERDINRPNLGVAEEYNVSPRTTVSFSAEFAASGDPTKAPLWGTLMRACGFAEVIDATAGSERVIYRLVDDAFESITLYYLWDGQLQKIHGARGNVKISLAEKSLPKFEFNFMGSYQRPVNDNIAPDFSGWQQPLPVTEANTPVWSIHGYGAIGSAFNLDIGHTVTHGNRPGEEKFAITDRKSIGDTTIKAPDLTSKDFFAAVESHTGQIELGPVHIQHGQTAGQIMEVLLPNTQLGWSGKADLDGEVGYQLSVRAKPTDAGNDEVAVIVR